MNKIILFIIINIFLFNCKEIKYNHSSKENNLFFVLTTFRHGARNSYYKTDIFNNKILWPGQLTEYGRKQHLNIGKKLRKRYFYFLKLNKKKFDKDQLYARSTQIRRAKISTLKQLEGLLNTDKINISYIDVKSIQKSRMNLYSFNDTEIDNILDYYKSCSLRKLDIGKNKKDYFKNHIIPIYEKCFGKFNETQKKKGFCDNTISAFFQYQYNNRKNNLIVKCGYKTAKLFYDYCVEKFDSMRYKNEKTSYIMFVFFKHIFKYMQDSIEKKSKLKMIMIGGHDKTLSQLLNFFNGLNIVKRTEYPHYAYNIVFELRKYNDKFYLEIYYNDNLKYNRTLKQFKNTLYKSKYSNLYNYCGVPKNSKNNNSDDNENSSPVKNKKKLKSTLKEFVDNLEKGKKFHKSLITKEITTILSYFIIICFLIFIVVIYIKNYKKKRKRRMAFINKTLAYAKLLI